jgi:short-subunit dehydrogenase
MNRAALPQMKRQGSGLLLHVSSGAGRLAIPALGMYCASKFALEALAEVYRYELAALGIDSSRDRTGRVSHADHGQSCARRGFRAQEWLR